jgi:hypothetical protein
MELRKTVKYRQFYLPNKRCRKERYQILETEVPLEIREYKKADLPVAMTAQGRVVRYDDPTVYFTDDYRVLDGKLYRPARTVSGGDLGKIEPVSRIISNYWVNVPYDPTFKPDNAGFIPGESIIREHPDEPYTEARQVGELQKLARQYILVDGVLYEEAGEPYYNISVDYTWGVNGKKRVFLRIEERSGGGPVLDKDRGFNALEVGLMTRLYPEIADELLNRAIRVTSGFESYVRLRRNLKSGLYTWSDGRLRYEWTLAGSGPVWEITFEDDHEEPHAARISAAGENEALGLFFRNNPKVSFSQIRVRRLPADAR